MNNPIDEARLAEIDKLPPVWIATCRCGGDAFAGMTKDDVIADSVLGHDGDGCLLSVKRVVLNDLCSALRAAWKERDEGLKTPPNAPLFCACCGTKLATEPARGEEGKVIIAVCPGCQSRCRQLVEKSDARWETAERERDEARARHTTYLDGIEAVLGPIRQRRYSGEPARSDREEIAVLLAERDLARAEAAALRHALKRVLATALPTWDNPLQDWKGNCRRADDILSSTTAGADLLAWMREAALLLSAEGDLAGACVVDMVRQAIRLGLLNEGE